MIDVSIIIVNYNCLDILDNCLLTLFQFTAGINYEVIVVDNNSTSGNVEEVTNKYPGVILIKNKTNAGFAAANNQGVKIAKGRYILFLNNDTVFKENVIKATVDFADSKNEPVIVGCNLLNPDGSNQESADCFPTVWNAFTENFFIYKLFPKSAVFNKYYIKYQNYNEPCEVDVVKGAYLMGPKEIINKYNGFDERFFFYAEETDLCYRFKKDGGKVYFYPNASLIHLGGATTDNYPWFKYRNQHVAIIRFYQKHFKGLSFAAVILIRYTGLIIRVPLYAILGMLTFKKYLFLKSFYYLKQFFIYPKNIFNS